MLNESHVLLSIFRFLDMEFAISKLSSFLSENLESGSLTDQLANLMLTKGELKFKLLSTGLYFSYRSYS